MSSKQQRTQLVPSIRKLGVDLSTNHAAFVLLNDNALDDYLIVTDTKSIADCSDKAILMDLQTKGEAHAMDRLVWWDAMLPGILKQFSPDYVAIEDYAYGAKQGAHQLGEVGGILRRHLWTMGRPLRKYTPGQIKKFAVHKGRAEKDEMVMGVLQRWGMDWRFLRPVKKDKPTKMWTSAEDAADAFACAKLLDTEILLRKGRLKLDMLHEKEIEIFNTVSKKGDVNLLAQDFIQKAA